MGGVAPASADFLATATEPPVEVSYSSRPAYGGHYALGAAAAFRIELHKPGLSPGGVAGGVRPGGFSTSAMPAPRALSFAPA